MRAISLVIVLAFALSGCLGGNNSPTPATPSGSSEATGEAPGLEPVVPEPIEASETVTGGLNVLGVLRQSSCGGASTACYRYPFEIVDAVSVEGTITWGLTASDFDMFLYKGNTLVASGTSNPPGTTEYFRAELDAGAYAIVVTPVVVVRDTFQLAATFAPTEAAT